ncbi:MAG: NDP-sugar synthase [Myxococcales bacterium]|nr:NDP-sugar synthase [Myxococcales bacterium]
MTRPNSTTISCAMLLCAGKGTRLGDISAECPKPLLPVCNIPILRYGITNLVANGITNIVINLRHRGELISDELGDGSEMGARIQYSHENEILGTGGGLKKALTLLDPGGTDAPILSMNGKLIFDLDIAGLLDSFLAAGDTLGTMVVQAAPNAMKWGAVDVRPEGDDLRVHNILGEGSHMFCGVHLTRPSALKKLPEGEACTVRQGYLPWIQDGGRVTAFEHRSGYFAEHSTPKRYLQSNIELLRGATLRTPPGTLSGIDASASVDPTSTITEPVCIGKGVTIGPNCSVGPGVVIGDGCSVAEGSSLRASVLWPSVQFSGSAEHEIITPSTRIPASGGDDVDG